MLIFLLILLALSAAAFAVETYLRKLYAQEGLTIDALLKKRRDAMASLAEGYGDTSKKNVHHTEKHLHPYFGVVFHPAVPHVNNFGFKCPRNIHLTEQGYEFEELNRAETVVIGIFGGSFANGCATGAREYLEGLLKDQFPGRKPFVANFSMGGAAYPVQLNILTYFRHLVDICVVIDGYNEVMNPLQNNRMGLPPEYAFGPTYKHRLSLDCLTPESFQLTAQMLRARDQLVALTALANAPGVNRTASMHKIWSLSFKRLNETLSQTQSEIVKLYESSKRFFDVSDTRIREFAIQQWIEYHMLFYFFCRHLKLPSFHFLQPNPYAGNCKPLTDKEKLVLDQYRSIQQAFDGTYEDLRKGIKQLQQNGLLAYDLCNIYESVETDIWVDGCHSTVEGYRIVMHAVGEALQQSFSRLREPLPLYSAT